MKKKYSKYLMKLMLFNLLLGTLPVILLGAYSHYRTTSIIKNNIYEANMQILKQTQMRVEQILKITDYTASQFVVSPFVNECIRTTLSNRNFAFFRDLSTRLHNMQRYELGIRDVYLFNLKNHWFIHNEAVYDLDEHTDIKKLSDYIENTSSSFWVIHEPNSVDATTQDSEGISYFPKISLIKKIPINSSRPAALLSVDIPGYEFSKLIVRNSGMGTVMVLDDKYRILVSSHLDNVNNNILTSGHITQLRRADAPEGYFSTILGKEHTLMLFVKSDYNNWFYIYAIPISNLVKEQRAIGWMTLLICLSVFTLITFMSLHGSWRMYMPIRKLYEAMKGKGENEEQPVGKDEFQFIRERVINMINEDFELKEAIKGHMEQLKEFFIIKLLHKEMERSELEEKLSLFNLPTRWKWMAVFAIQIDTLEESPFKEGDHELVMFAVNNIASEVINKEQRLNLVSLDGYLVVLVGSEHENKEVFRGYANALAQILQKIIHQYLHIRISIGISDAFNSYLGVHSAYLQSLEALKYRIGLKNEAVLWYDDMYKKDTSNIDISKDVQAQLLQAIEKGDMKEVDELLPLCFEEIFSNKLCIQRCEFLLVTLLVDILNLVPNSSECLKKVFDNRKSVFDQLFELKTISEVQAWFRQDIIEPVAEWIKEYRDQQSKSISQKVIELIEKYYDQELTLETCAEQINYNVSYISRVFREETGIPFSEYLWQYRIKVAKKWLVETDMKISEIAERLQYNNAQNFIRSFRKVERITPGQYRKNHWKNK